MSSALHPSNSSGGGKGRDRLALDDLAAVLCPMLCPPVNIVDDAVGWRLCWVQDGGEGGWEVGLVVGGARSGLLAV
ncbi:hypothetical protein BDE02_03G029400 [Populus trichocarpa]|nr:hypothetical protein BDE02_03G029400 [Populus trichocarpa]